MTPVADGAWWDPEDGTTPAARTASHPRAHIKPRAEAAAGVGATGDPVHVAGASRWWTVGVVAFGVLAVVAAVSAVVLSDRWWAVLVVVAAGTAVLLAVIEGGQPRRVAASPSGIEVSSRRGSRQVPWERLRRVRGPREFGFAQLDTHLELTTGELVRLPPRTPGGVVEGWRERHRGDRPVPRLPQLWRLSEEEATQQFWYVNNGGVFLGIVAFHLMNAVFDLPAPVSIAVSIAVVSLLTLALSRRPVRAIRADEHGLTLPGWRQTRISWAHVRDVRRKGRYEPQVVVHVASGQQREILGPDLDVVTEWWHLAVPPDRREAQAAG